MSHLQYYIFSDSVCGGSALKHQVSSRFWVKTVAALLWGFILSASAMINLYFVLPLSAGGTLLASVIFGFIFWGLAMCFCYSFKSAWRASWYCFVVFLASGACNGFLILTH